MEVKTCRCMHVAVRIDATTRQPLQVAPEQAQYIDIVGHASEMQVVET